MLRLLLFLINFYMKGGEIMVDLYLALVINGRRTIDQVPVKFREAVKQDLIALGLDEQGNVVA